MFARTNINCENTPTTASDSKLLLRSLTRMFDDVRLTCLFELTQHAKERPMLRTIRHNCSDVWRERSTTFDLSVNSNKNKLWKQAKCCERFETVAHKFDANVRRRSTWVFVRTDVNCESAPQAASDSKQMPRNLTRTFDDVRLTMVVRTNINSENETQVPGIQNNRSEVWRERSTTFDSSVCSK